ncbi:MAG: hypothetical protein HFG56_05760 [Lachnospiraceae bacterium]|nr:hypothetical protein [Lachnospiraceae bacterium]
MKLRYIGTGAAEGFPGMFCQCDACVRARKTGGKNIKTRSCAILNDQVLIDLSPDIYTQSLKLGIELWKIKHLIVTHTHQDHLDRFFLSTRAKDGATILPAVEDRENCLRIYGSEAVHMAMIQALEEEVHANRNRLLYVPALPRRWFETGGLFFYPLKANHRPDELCLIYVVSDGKKSLLYANDTGMLSKETMEEIRGLGLTFQVVSMDCARGSLPGDGHMGFEENRWLREELRQLGCVGPDTRYYLNHLSHMSGIIHDDMERLMGPEGFIAAYDGLEIKV